MGLFAVPLQLYFPGMENPTRRIGRRGDELDALRDRRNGRAWLKSAIAYCDWRAGRELSPWRERAERSARSEYLDAARLLIDLLHRPQAEPLLPQLALPILNAEPGYSREELELAKRSTTSLVDELMRTDPRYTLRRSLLRFRRAKLARMLVRARAQAAGAQPERRLA